MRPANTIFVPAVNSDIVKQILWRQERTDCNDRSHNIDTWDIFLGVDEIFVQGFLTPRDALVNIGLGVGEASRLACLSAPDSVEVWSLLVLATSLDSVTLGTRLREDLLASSSTHLTLKMLSG